MAEKHVVKADNVTKDVILLHTLSVNRQAHEIYLLKDICEFSTRIIICVDTSVNGALTGL